MGDAATTKAVIHEAAKKEFLDKGFEQASLRKIVKDAGVTTGAFYKYYGTKEELFSALVEPCANTMFAVYDDTLQDFEAQSPTKQTQNMLEYSNRGANDIFDYMYDMYDNFDTFVLLLCKAESTRYETFIHELAVRQVNSTLQYIETMRRAGVDIPEIDRGLCHMISNGFFSGFFEIIIHDMDKASAKKRIEQLKTFYAGGWEKLFGLHFGAE